MHDWNEIALAKTLFIFFPVHNFGNGYLLCRRHPFQKPNYPQSPHCNRSNAIQIGKFHAHSLQISTSISDGVELSMLEICMWSKGTMLTAVWPDFFYVNTYKSTSHKKTYLIKRSPNGRFAPHFTRLLELTLLDQQLEEFRLPDPTRSEDKAYEFSGI